MDTPLAGEPSSRRAGPTSGSITPVQRRSADLFARHQNALYRQADRVCLMALQWAAGVLFALWVSPLAWEGAASWTHMHVWAAIVLGGVISLPALLGVMACRRRVAEMRDTAERTAALEQEVRTRQETEESLARHSQELETARDRERRNDFLASMSHELRTPVNAIILYSELLQEEAKDEGHERSVDDLKKIQSAGKHLLELFNGILDLSKIEAGRMRCPARPSIFGRPSRGSRTRFSRSS